MKNISFTGYAFIACSLMAADNGLAPEIIDLNARDASIQLESRLPYLSEPYISFSPFDMGDELKVSSLSSRDFDRIKLVKFIDKLAAKNSNNTDSLLISFKNKLVTECYFRRGRQNFPHYQMSITKSYTAFAVGRAIHLGYLKMEDLNKKFSKSD